jgi:hypothetical protein
LHIFILITISNKNPFSSNILFGGLSNVFAEGDFTIVDSDGKTAIGIGAHPGFEHYGSALPAIIRKRNQYPVVTLLAFWKKLLEHIHRRTSS